ncbi:flagellar M-ring protein FliF [Kineococcus sp. R8]|uniref:flagellar basal-body MS-ring/collar protein FliF n=1 Tax=Kineococcus siccus TaxID=2696567 RepID=UPI00141270D4|nr:flagellar basal-body MS-ring/collar protein FliF [Kineococcus siccus]NAZ82849.1 flagellar M-ring protein FliF [Kineococcus siccus]
MAQATKGPAAIVEGAKRFATGFKSFSAGQKAVVLAVVTALIVGGVLFSQWVAKPTYTPMFSNLSGADASAIVEQLKSAGVPYELSDNGATISVPQAAVYEQRLQAAAEGLPADTESGYALLNEQSGVTTSEFMQQKNYQEALSSELEKTIESIDGVETSKINLAMPAKSVFLNEQDPVTASVLVMLKPGKSLTSDQVLSVVNLVARGVEGMDPKNVSVVDGKGNTLSTDDSGAGAMQQKTGDYNTAASGALQQQLEAVLGQGNVIATVNATLDFDARTSTSKQFTQPDGVDPIASSSSEEIYDGAGNPVGGVLGPDNIQVPAGEGAGEGGYTKKDVSEENAVNTVEEVTQAAPGSVKRQSVAVVIDATKAGAADVNQITQFVTNAAGLDPGRGDTVTVTKMAFDASAATEAGAALEAAQKAEEQDALIGYAKTAALALLVLVMLIMVLVAFRRRKDESVDVLDVNAPPISLGDITDENAEPRMLEQGVPRQRIALEPAPVDPALEAAAARRDEVVELVSRQPEEVAELLRGWLADRRS